MRDDNNFIYVVDLTLKDGKGEIKNCIIFESDEKGQESIQDYNKLVEILNRREFFTFQNRYIHGTTSINNIKCYIINQIRGKEF